MSLQTCSKLEIYFLIQYTKSIDSHGLNKLKISDISVYTIEYFANTQNKRNERKRFAMESTESKLRNIGTEQSVKDADIIHNHIRFSGILKAEIDGKLRRGHYIYVTLCYMGEDGFENVLATQDIYLEYTHKKRLEQIYNDQGKRRHYHPPYIFGFKVKMI